MAGYMCARQYYNEPMAGFSLPAAEHSTITSWGRDGEPKAFANMLTAYVLTQVTALLRHISHMRIIASHQSHYCVTAPCAVLLLKNFVAFYKLSCPFLIIITRYCDPSLTTWHCDHVIINMTSG